MEFQSQPFLEILVFDLFLTKNSAKQIIFLSYLRKMFCNIILPLKLQKKLKLILFLFKNSCS